jgi:hypothetical protein
MAELHSCVTYIIQPGGVLGKDLLKLLCFVYFIFKKNSFLIQYKGEKTGIKQNHQPILEKGIEDSKGLPEVSAPLKKTALNSILARICSG